MSRSETVPRPQPGRQHRRWSPTRIVGGLIVVAVVAVMLLPLATIAYFAASGGGSTWQHLASTVLPRAIRDTGMLLVGASVTTLVIGTSTAWLVTMYRFPGRDLLDRLLVIPLAMPTYIIAYCYVELLDSSGTLLALARTLFGPGASVPDIRTTWGAIAVMSLVLYPYVYLSARASFEQQSVCALEVARTLGRTSTGVFWAVGLPMARPALIAGVALVMMECLNDIGAVEYLGVETLTSTVYATWIERRSLGGASQIASVMLLMVFALFAAERWSRGRARFDQAGGRYQPVTFAELRGWRGALATTACLLPFVVGFVIPVSVLVSNALSYGWSRLGGRFWHAAETSLILAAGAAVITVIVGLAFAHLRRIRAFPKLEPLMQLAGLGYAIPGTVLAIGLIYPLSTADLQLNAWVEDLTGWRLGQLLGGTVVTMLIAYTIRFAAISIGTIDAGFQRISPNIDAAARTLGSNRQAVLFKIHLPMALPAIGAGALMVFVDAMKELPATLLLRPLDMETLAVLVYAKADAFEFADASIAALAIVCVGLLPILMLHRVVARGRRLPAANEPAATVAAPAPNQ